MEGSLGFFGDQLLVGRTMSSCFLGHLCSLLSLPSIFYGKPVTRAHTISMQPLQTTTTTYWKALQMASWIMGLQVLGTCDRALLTSRYCGDTQQVLVHLNDPLVPALC